MIVHYREDYSIQRISSTKDTVLPKSETFRLIINHYNAQIKDEKKVFCFGYSGLLNHAISLYAPELLGEGIVWLELTENT